MNKKIINADGILVRTVSKMRAYYSMSHNFSTFNTPHDVLFLVFGVSNAQYLAFDTLDENALNVKCFVLFASTYKSMPKWSTYKSSLRDSIFRWISRGKNATSDMIKP